MRTTNGSSKKIISDKLDPNSQPERVPRGGELRSELSSISNLIEQLESAMNSLPHVEKNGGSECPFAEDWYAKKEELEKKIAFEVGRISQYLVFLEKEVQRCKGNLAKISSDATRLHHEETKDRYSDAQLKQERECRLAIQDRDAVFVVLQKAEAVLKVSRTRKFPGREPQRDPFSPPAFPGGSQTPGQGGPGQPPPLILAEPSDVKEIDKQPTSKASSTPSGSGSELDNLLELGPLDKP